MALLPVAITEDAYPVAPLQWICRPGLCLALLPVDDLDQPNVLPRLIMEVAQAQFKVASYGTTLPLRFGARLSDTSGAEAWLDSRMASVTPALDRVRGCSEYLVSLPLPGTHDYRVLYRKNNDLYGKSAGKGLAYLAGQRKAYSEFSQIDPLTLVLSQRLPRKMSPWVRSAKPEAAAEGRDRDRLYLLVENSGLSQLKGRLEHLDGVCLRVMGPWPTHHFSDSWQENWCTLSAAG